MNDITILDGGFGTMIQAAGLAAGKDPTDWNIENPSAVTSVHRAYAEAGAEIILANTFGANRIKYHGPHDLGGLVRSALANARAAFGDASGAGRVALDVGPTGKLLKPAGDLAFADAYAAYSELIRIAIAADAKPDLIFIETMSDAYELKAAVLAAKDNCSLPVYATVALGEDGRLLTGGTVECVSALLESLHVDAYGFNCGLGPDRMLPHVERLAGISSKPIIVKPNAGMPRIENGQTSFDVGPEAFAEHVSRLIDAGAAIVGGCCGTTPAHIRALNRPMTIVSSGTQTVELRPYMGLIIGERINPTGKKRLKEAYASGDTAYILREAVKQVEAGAKILDVNCGVPGLDEVALLEATVPAVQSVANCPVQIDTADPEALERAMKAVNGKPLVNSVTGAKASMAAVLPLAGKYGGALVALCLDESGIPPTADGRLAIARRILAEGRRHGLGKNDFVFDALTLSVSADANAALVTLETVRRLTEELHVNTVLGVSNVSFGLPNRPALNNAMYSLAKKAGLSAAIANPSLIRDETDSAAIDVLTGRDTNCARWIAANTAPAGDATPSGTGGESAASPKRLYDSIVHGLKEDAAAAAREELSSGKAALNVIQSGIVPALEEIGRGFERGSAYLPQLLMSADAAGEAFAVVKGALADGRRQPTAVTRRSPIVLATVRGDIHDIGKNIVRALLESYGFTVIDLGRDVPPEKIVEAAAKAKAGLVGLSALMTTTVGAMQETIRLLKKANADCKTVVGGAVVTQDFADSIGADFYAKDAMRTVRIAEETL